MRQARLREAAVSLDTIGLAAALSGCMTFTDERGSNAGTGQADAPTPRPTEASGLDDRTPLASCGVVVLDHGETVPDASWACMDERSGSGAELVVTTPTEEGDPVVTYYRVGPEIEGLELFIDRREDRFTSPDLRRVTRQACSQTITAAEPLGCSDS